MDDIRPKPESPANPEQVPNPFCQVPVEITISVGRARPRVSDLLQLQMNSVLVLDQRLDDPVDLFVGDQLIARGELQELDGDMEGQLAVRITEVADMKNGI